MTVEMMSLIATFCGALLMVITTLSWNLRRSRCTHIECYGAACDRVLMTIDEQKNDILNKKMFLSL